MLRQVADLVGGEQRTGNMLVADGGIALGEEGGAVAAFGGEDHRALTEQIGGKPCAVVIVDSEHLQHRDIGHEGAGALTVCRVKLVKVLQDGP